MALLEDYLAKSEAQYMEQINRPLNIDVPKPRPVSFSAWLEISAGAFIWGVLFGMAFLFFLMGFHS